MCVIATKKTGFALPDKETLERCFEHNHDGAGFAWNADNKVHWIKGLMTFDAFYTALKEKFPTPELELGASIVMHFRIGTHGPKKTESHTHPFPIVVESMSDTCSLTGENDAVLFHNGIMHDMVKLNTTKVKDSTGVEVEPSDSQIFTYLFARPLWNTLRAGTLSPDDFNLIMGQLTDGQRISILDSYGTICNYGYWHTDETLYPGCQFSNTSYEAPKVYPAVTPFEKHWGKVTDDEYAVNLSMKAYLNDDTFYDGSYNQWWNKRKKATNMIETTSPTTFWNSYHKQELSPHAIKNLDLQELPEGTLISERPNSKKFVTYCPAIDGKILYRMSSKTAVHLAVLYIEKENAVHLIGTYNITLPTWEGTKVELGKKQYRISDTSL